MRDQAKSLVERADAPLQAVIFDAAVQDSLDITSSDVLKALIKELRDQGLAVCAAEVHAPVIAFGRKSGLSEVLDAVHIFATIDGAVSACAAAFDGGHGRQG